MRLDLWEIVLAVILIAVILRAVPQRLPRPAPPINNNAEVHITQEDWRYDWCNNLLRELEQRPSEQAIGVCMEWTQAEDRGNGAYERNNPLNTTQPMPCAVDTINSHGVKSYGTLECGLQATVITITNGLYTDILACWCREAIWASPWAADHYDYGGRWP